jgi:aspartate/methionine/tyrosine aminotransferase
MRQAVLNLEESMIRQVANAGMGRSDVLKFWFGESDEPTPQVVRDAAARSLQAGETFYSHNLGLPELRDAIAAYVGALHRSDRQPLEPASIAVTSGGVHALMLAVQALVDAGDEVVVVTPVWPNLMAQPAIMGAKVVCVSLQARQGAWSLDLQRLLDRVTEKTRLLVINSPNNPTGWTLTRTEQQALLAHCRRTGTWLLADEVYERLYYESSERDCAPSFLDLALPDDRLLVAHSFSKSFLMTGWRLGWLVVPPALTPQVGKLIEFNTSCAPVFVQHAGLAALRHAPSITPRVVGHLRKCRDTLVPLLQALDEIELAAAPGGMYAFFRMRDAKRFGNSLQTAQRLVAEAGLGLAPGDAFMPPAHEKSAAVWLRWCFATQDTDRLREGAARLEKWLRL